MARHHALRASAGLIVTEGTAPDPSTFFTPGEKGYLDYPDWPDSSPRAA